MIGALQLSVPVLLAPMAGITNTAFRRLCREYGGGLFVGEMVTSRALVERTPTSLRLLQHHASETPRSIQLYGVDASTVANAVAYVRGEDLADHIDLNFGCPVPKVTRKGGGAVLPWKTKLFQAIVASAVRAAGSIPVTVKIRKGIDADHLSYLNAGRAAVDAGAAAITLHGRTAADLYGGHADWQAIANLKQCVREIPVFGNGDIWCADDALRMISETGCDGVVVGRGCLGRPWLFAELEAAFRLRAGEISPEQAARRTIHPPLGEVLDALTRHTALLTEFFSGDEQRACRDIRKHFGWYFKGYGVGSQMRQALNGVESERQLAEILATADRTLPYPGGAAEGPRGRTSRAKRVALPSGWLDSRDSDTIDFGQLAEAERDDSGG